MSSLVSGLAFLFLATFICFKISKNLSERKKFFKSLIDFNSDLIMEIEFQRAELSNILLRPYQSEDFNRVLKQKLNLNKGITNEMIFPTYIKQTECFELKEYFYKMGMQDPYTSIELLKRYDDIFKKLYNEVLEEDRVKGSLYKKMGLIIGIIAFIIVI